MTRNKLVCSSIEDEGKEYWVVETKDKQDFIKYVLYNSELELLINKIWLIIKENKELLEDEEYKDLFMHITVCLANSKSIPQLMFDEDKEIMDEIYNDYLIQTINFLREGEQ